MIAFEKVCEDHRPTCGGSATSIRHGLHHHRQETGIKVAHVEAGLRSRT